MKGFGRGSRQPRQPRKRVTTRFGAPRAGHNEQHEEQADMNLGKRKRDGDDDGDYEGGHGVHFDDGAGDENPEFEQIEMDIDEEDARMFGDQEDLVSRESLHESSRIRPGRVGRGDVGWN